MDISVIMPTNRPGGFDVVFDGLSKQTFKNFEIIISDCLYSKRHEMVKKRAKAYDVNYKHIEPFDNPFPTNAYCRVMNSALAYASGKLVILITDYTWLPNKNLETHWNYFCSHGQDINKGLMGPHQYIAMPPLHTDAPTYKVVPSLVSMENESSNTTERIRYMDDLQSGKFDQLMWSIFDTEFNYDQTKDSALPLCQHMSNADPKLRMGSGNIAACNLHCKNESLALEKVLQANGFNEELDGNHGWQDTEFAERLNMSWELIPDNFAYIINPRYTFPPVERKWDGGSHPNWNIFERLRSEGLPNNNVWSILDKRAELQTLLDNYNLATQTVQISTTIRGDQ